MLRIVAAACFVCTATSHPSWKLRQNSRDDDRAVPRPTKIDVFQQPLDHFDRQSRAVFDMRYFLYDKQYRRGGPVFFYAGNEGRLDEFYNNTGLPFDWAEEFGAMVVFAEHRYYGDSLPFGSASFETANLRWLQINQVLADYALFVSDFKTKLGVETPVVVFGGSYGGVLAAFLRIKYPDVFDMALAASAPIPQTYNLIPPTSFFTAVTADAARANALCPDATRAAFAEVIESFSSESGRKMLSELFGLCSTLEEHDLSHFLQYARNAFTEMAMCDYPYPSTFLAPLPANPINVACDHIVANGTKGLAQAVAMPYGADGCMDMFTSFVECADQTGCGVGADAKAWDYQMCSEVIYEQATNNVSDMFPPREWTLANLTAYCQKHYGTSIDLNFLRIAFGGVNLQKVTSRIIFSNGDLDPWAAGGFSKDLSPSLPAVLVKGGAHHLDLRLAHPKDPEAVVEARQREKVYIQTWIQEIVAERVNLWI